MIRLLDAAQPLAGGLSRRTSVAQLSKSYMYALTTYFRDGHHPGHM